MSEKPRRSYRCSDEEYEAIKKQAKLEGRKPANLVYYAVMQYLKKKGKGE